jgi:hypothetical protein
MRKDGQRQNIFVSRDNIRDLATAFALSDALLNMIVKAAEQFRATDTSINPDSLITYISMHRPKFLESQDEQN